MLCYIAPKYHSFSISRTSRQLSLLLWIATVMTFAWHVERHYHVQIFGTVPTLDTWKLGKGSSPRIWYLQVNLTPWRRNSSSAVFHRFRSSDELSRLNWSSIEVWCVTFSCFCPCASSRPVFMRQLGSKQFADATGPLFLFSEICLVHTGPQSAKPG